jgi:hypothetical protein
MTPDAPEIPTIKRRGLGSEDFSLHVPFCCGALKTSAAKPRQAKPRHTMKSEQIIAFYDCHHQ